MGRKELVSLGLSQGTQGHEDAYLLCVPEKVCSPRCEMRAFGSDQQFQTVEDWQYEGQTIALYCALGRPNVKSWGQVTCSVSLPIGSGFPFF